MMRSESLGRLEAPCFLLLFLRRSVDTLISSCSCVAGLWRRGCATRMWQRRG